jgi:hypothetical protein
MTLARSPFIVIYINELVIIRPQSTTDGLYSTTQYKITIHKDGDFAILAQRGIVDEVGTRVRTYLDAEGPKQKKVTMADLQPLRLAA